MRELLSGVMYYPENSAARGMAVDDCDAGQNHPTASGESPHAHFVAGRYYPGAPSPSSEGSAFRKFHDPGFQMTQLYTPSSIGYSRPQGLSLDYGVEGRTVAVPNPRFETLTSEHEPPLPALAEARRERILIVDDDPSLRDVLSTVLQGCSYKVECAADGEEAWQALHERQFNLLITDQDMPRLTGIELLRRLRGRFDCIPAILVSGKMPWGEPDLEALLTPGLAIEKPYSLMQLLVEVRRLVSSTVSSSWVSGSGSMPLRVASAP